MIGKGIATLPEYRAPFIVVDAVGGFVFNSFAVVVDFARSAESVVEDEKLVAVKTALDGTDDEAIKSATDSLMQASQEFSQRLYDAASASDGGVDGPDMTGSADDDDDVVDAEIIEDDEASS